MAARCEAAGRDNNEDNYQLSDNLETNQWSFTTDKTIALGDKGALLAVADGMGGMNAGEVASALVIETLKEDFASDTLTDDVMSSPENIKTHIKNAIVAADTRIKQQSATDPATEGMGSTVVILWIVGQTAYVGWCGDSRAYRFNPADGLVRLSHDHSYVQELVDAGKLKEELAFDHPQNNIITRSLGDSHRKVRPDVASYPLRDGDVLLLCSDGLSGVLRDEQIEHILHESQTEPIGRRRDLLWQAAEEAGWDDNVTTCLCYVESGAVVTTQTAPGMAGGKRKSIKRILRAVITVIIAALLFGAGYYFEKSLSFKFLPKSNIVTGDSVASVDNKSTPSGNELQDNGVIAAKTITTPQNEVFDTNKPDTTIMLGKQKYDVYKENGIKYIQYKVGKGETIDAIAQRVKDYCTLSPQEIMQYNSDKKNIKKGDLIKIPWNVITVNN